MFVGRALSRDGQLFQHFGSQGIGLILTVDGDDAQVAFVFYGDHATPTFLRISGSRKDTSSPRNVSASEPHIHTNVLATHSGGM